MAVLIVANKQKLCKASSDVNSIPDRKAKQVVNVVIVIEGMAWETAS